MGGVQHYARTVIDAVSDQFEIDAVVSSRKIFSDSIQLPSGTMWRMGTLGILASTPISLFFPFKVWQLLKNKKYDIIHFNFPDPLALITFVFLKKKAKYIVSWHSDVVKQRWALSIYLPLLRYFLKKVDLILVATQSHFTSSTQLPRELQSKVRVVPYGIPDVPEESIAEPDLIKSLKGKKIIFTLGRHVYYKGYEYLIEAMSYVRNAILIMAGDGPLTEKYKGLICKLNLEEKIFLVGKLTDKELLGYFKYCDVFCLPSIEPSEAFGYVQVEAMRFGKPVVNCRLNNGVNEVSPDGVSGLTCEPRDSKELAECLNKLCTDQTRYLALSKGALENSKRFTFSNLRVNIKDNYFKLN